MKQVVIIRGGTTFARYEDYIESLRTKAVRLDRIAYASNWKDSLQDRLGADYKVLIPSMPNTANALYHEWQLYFNQVVKVLEDECILIGHSMGGIFLAKYLSENKLPIHVAATVLIAAPYSDESAEDLASFKLNELSPLFTQQAGKILLFGADDDPVIAASDFLRYQRELPGAKVHEVSAQDHYVRKDFPELVAALKTI